MFMWDTASIGRRKRGRYNKLGVKGAVYLVIFVVCVLFIGTVITPKDRNFEFKKPMNNIRLPNIAMGEVEYQKTKLVIDDVRESENGPSPLERTHSESKKHLPPILPEVKKLASSDTPKEIPRSLPSLKKLKVQRVADESKTQGRKELSDAELMFGFGHVLQLKQNDSKLLKFIRENHIIPPRPAAEPYHLKNETIQSFHYILPLPETESDIVFRLLEKKEGGFFVEADTHGGEQDSKTLALEISHNWTGLLIESDSTFLKDLLQVNRRAWISDTCLSGKPFPKHEIKQNPGTADANHNSADNLLMVKCLPLFSILSAINVFEIDYFRLDIDGRELQVLSTIPFDSVLIKFISVKTDSQQLAEDIVEYLESIDYVFIRRDEPRIGSNYLFVHKKMYKDGMKQGSSIMASKIKSE